MTKCNNRRGRRRTAAFGTHCHKLVRFLRAEGCGCTCTWFTLLLLRLGFDKWINTELDLAKAKNGPIRAKQAPKEVAAALSPMLLCCGACMQPSPPLPPCPQGIQTCSHGSHRVADSPPQLLLPPPGRRRSRGEAGVPHTDEPAGSPWMWLAHVPPTTVVTAVTHIRHCHLGRATGKCLITLATLIPCAWGRTRHWPDLENTYLCFQNMEQGALPRIQIQCKTNRASQTSCMKHVWVWKGYSEECHSCWAALCCAFIGILLWDAVLLSHHLGEGHHLDTPGATKNPVVFLNPSGCTLCPDSLPNWVIKLWPKTSAGLYSYPFPQ